MLINFFGRTLYRNFTFSLVSFRIKDFLKRNKLTFFPTVNAKVKNTEATNMKNKIVIRIVAVDGLGFFFLK